MCLVWVISTWWLVTRACGQGNWFTLVQCYVVCGGWWTKLQLQFKLTECSDHFSSLHLTLAGAGGFILLAFSPISHKFLPLWGPALHTHIPRVYISIKLKFFPWLLDCFCWEHPACSLQWTGVWVWDWCNSAIQIVDSPETDLCSQNLVNWTLQLEKSCAKLQCSAV